MFYRIVILVAARVVQGLGGAGLMTLSQALIGELIGPRQRVRFQGYFAAVFTAASVAGPVLGGSVVSHLSWRWLFLANLPLTAFAMWRLCKLPRGEPHPDTSGTHDLPGIALFALSTVTGLYWLISAGHHFSWVSKPSALLVVLSLVALGVLVWHECRHASPFLPIDLLQQKTIAFSLITTALFAACMFAMVFFLPIYLQFGHRVTAFHSGLLLLPLTAGMVIGSMITGRFVAQTGHAKFVPVGGMSLSSLALLLLGVLPPNTVLVGILGLVAGLGFGTVMPVNQVVAQTVAGRARLGAVTSMFSLFRSIGAASGAAVFGALVYALMPVIDETALAQAAPEIQTLSVTHAFHVAFIVAALVAAVAALASSRVPRVLLWSKPDAVSSAENVEEV
jgi:MFS family permease